MPSKPPKTVNRQDDAPRALFHRKGCPGDRLDRDTRHQSDRVPPGHVIKVLACIDCNSRLYWDPETGEELSQDIQTGPMAGSTYSGGMVTTMNRNEA